MIVLYIILAILAFLLCVTLFTKMTLLIKAEKADGEDFKTELSLLIFGKPVDLSKYINKNEKKETGEKSHEEKAKKPLSERLHNLRINIERGRYTYLLSKRYVKKKIKVEQLDFSLVFGLDDAAHTGIATGAAWGSVYNIFAFLDRLFTVKSHNFKINPVFDGECLALDFESRIRFSISNILALAFAVMINYIKSEKIIK